MNMNGFVRWVFGEETARASRAVALVRVLVGGVFVVSGFVKLLYANQGVNRFTRLGFPAPEVLAPLVSTVEIVAGLCLILGLAVRVAAIPLAVVMLAAIITSKLPLLTGPGPEPVNAEPRMGFWGFAYAARLDTAMLLGAAFLIAAGAGAWSLDAWLARRQAQGVSGTSRSESHPVPSRT